MSVGGENRGDKDPGATRPSVCNEEAERSCPAFALKPCS